MANSRRTKTMAVPLELVPQVEKMKTKFYECLDGAVDSARLKLAKKVIEDIEEAQSNG